MLQSPAEPFLHWFVLLSVLVMAGSLVFELFITRPVLAAGNAVKSMKEMDLRMEHRTLMVVLLAAGIAFAASLGELFIKAIVASRNLESLPLSSAIELIIETYWGHFWLWRMLMLFVAIGVPILVLSDWSTQRSGQRSWQIAALALSAGILFTLSMASHDAATTTIRATGIFTDYVHLLAASIWVGGIVYLAVVMPPAMKQYRREIKDTGRGTFCPTSHVSALGRFSFLAMVSAGALVITGLYSSWAQVTTLPALTYSLWNNAPGQNRADIPFGSFGSREPHLGKAEAGRKPESTLRIE